MCRFQRCCGCFSLGLGVFLIGAIELVIAFVAFGSACYITHEEFETQRHEVSYGFAVFSLIVYFIAAVFQCILIGGILSENTCLLLTWKCYSLFQIAIGSVVLLFAIYMLIEIDSEIHVFIYVAFLGGYIGVTVYGLLIVHNYILHEYEMSGRYGEDLEAQIKETEELRRRGTLKESNYARASET